MSLARTGKMLLVAAHVALAVYVLICLAHTLTGERRELADLRRQADQERAETEAARREIEVYHRQRSGLGTEDPYVVEQIARDRFDYRQPGEIPLPPRRSEGPTIEAR